MLCTLAHEPRKPIVVLLHSYHSVPGLDIKRVVLICKDDVAMCAMQFDGADQINLIDALPSTGFNEVPHLTNVRIVDKGFVLSGCRCISA